MFHILKQEGIYKLFQGPTAELIIYYNNFGILIDK